MGEMADYYNEHRDHDEDDAEEVVCKYCNSKKVEWRASSVKEGWVLYNEDGTRHRCSLLTAYRKKFG